MRTTGAIAGTDSVSIDGRTWLPAASVALASVPELRGERDEISLPPLDLEGDRGMMSPAATPPPSRLEWDGPGADGDAFVSLELDDHRSRPPGPPPAPGPRNGPGPTVASPPRPPPTPGRANVRTLGTLAGDSRSRAALGLGIGLDAELDTDDGIPKATLSPIGTEASAAVAALLEGETERAVDPTARVLLDSPAAPAAQVRRRTQTMTAALPESPEARGRLGFRTGRRRTILMIAGALGLGAAVAAEMSGLVERVRGEPSSMTFLAAGPAELTEGLAQDRFAAYIDAAVRLEAAADSRRRAPETRAAASELLAQALVLHGGSVGNDPARLAHAEELLEAARRESPRETTLRLRAAGWLALARGHWKEAEEAAARSELDTVPADRAVIAGWAAFGRGDFRKAALMFSEAERTSTRTSTTTSTSPPAAPSAAATRLALARAHEAGLSPAASADYMGVLALAPTHFGASLGLARLSSLSAAARAKLARTALDALGRSGAPYERTDGFVFLARTARQADDPASSEAALVHARAEGPGNPALAVLEGDRLLEAGRSEEALLRYRTAVTVPLASPVTPPLRLARAAAFLESGRRVEAEAILSDLARGLPQSAAPIFWLGRMAERATPPDAAAAEHRYREALARDGGFVPAVLQLARILIETHRAREALEVLARAETHGASAIAIRLALGQAQLGAGNATAAAATFRQLLGAATRVPGGSAAPRDLRNLPELTAAHLGLAVALEGTGNLDGARAELALLTAAGPPDPQLTPRIAALLARLGQRAEALALYTQLVTAGQATPTTRVAAARLALTLGRRSEARVFATQAVDEDPRTPGGLLLLAELSRQGGNPAQAVAELKRAVAVDASPEVELELGRALGMLGRDEEALAALTEAGSLPAAGIERGRILVRRGDFEGASRVLSAALAKLPTSGEAFLWLGIAEDRLGQVSAAETAWRSAVRLMPGSSEARYRLGRLEVEHAQTAAALRELRAAAETLPAEGAWRADLFFQLGFAEKRQGSPARAQSAFRRYLELAPLDAPARAEVTRQLGGQPLPPS
jgi:tetratricopeptide (TPR) repeat protein